MDWQRPFREKNESNGQDARTSGKAWGCLFFFLIDFGIFCPSLSAKEQLFFSRGGLNQRWCKPLGSCYPSATSKWPLSVRSKLLHVDFIGCQRTRLLPLREALVAHRCTLDACTWTEIRPARWIRYSPSSLHGNG